MKTRSTTILGLIHNGEAAMAGDGQVTFDDTIMKARATKIRTMYDDRVLVGFAGTAADALALFELFEKKLEEYDGNLARASVELAKDWRTDKMLRRLEALITVTDGEHLFLISGTGDVIEPDDNVIAIGSGGPFALAAARALVFAKPEMTAEAIVRKALEIAADICVFTNDHVSVVTIK